jgi:hypothetical protein
MPRPTCLRLTPPAPPPPAPPQVEAHDKSQVPPRPALPCSCHGPHLACLNTSLAAPQQYKVGKSILERCSIVGLYGDDSDSEGC